jgi:phage tail sheath protein FI
MNYNSPGVFIEEISKFPPSVAAVETAIPAFIGYTERATRVTVGDLDLQPTRITSLLEYEQFFGNGPAPNVTAVNIDENNTLTSADMSQAYHLYDSVRLFYANGGGPCYITSIGLYSDNVNQLGDYQAGLAQVRRVDEVTLLCFPDAVRLSNPTDLYTLQIDAMGQCFDLKDRFVICDLLENRTGIPTFDWTAGYQEFRQNIGVNNLRYGAAYTPHLITNLGAELTFRDIQNRVFRGGITVDLSTLTDSTDAQAALTNLILAINDNNTIGTSVASLQGTQPSIRAAFLELVDAFRTTNNTVNYRAVINYIYSLVQTIDGWADASGTPLSNPSQVTDIRNLISGSLGASTRSLVSFEKGANQELSATYEQFSTLTFNSPEWVETFNPTSPPGPPVDATPFAGGATDLDRRIISLPSLLNIFEQIYAAFASIIQSASENESNGEQSLFDQHVVYRNLITALRALTTVLPPSGAIAGIYAQIDNDRGVFKAPANVSINRAIGLTEAIQQSEQDVLNMDPISGKSINAIRSFTGRGILVWGARTLAGNDNEWRYVNVRRFFNFAEESIKKATEPFVFEPNDANTWAKIRSMITNFLTIQWRDGALQGAKPAQAFFVKVGLGETMTALDILEGRLIIEIGMAVVRPAEFIILRFSHKLPEA